MQNSDSSPPLQLSPATISAADARVVRPAYDRSRLAKGIVHLGLGAFHRAHQAIHTEQVVAGGDMRWGIVGVSLRDQRVPLTLASQDCLYSVTERHGDHARTQVVGALLCALHAPTQLEAVIASMADPATAIVTTTVTEKGYSQNPASGDLDLDDPAIRHDIQNPQAPAPRSVSWPRASAGGRPVRH